MPLHGARALIPVGAQSCVCKGLVATGVSPLLATAGGPSTSTSAEGTCCGFAGREAPCLCPQR